MKCDICEALRVNALIWAVIIAFVLLAQTFRAPAHGAGYSDDPAIRRWFDEEVVKRCCSKADGFEADEYESVQGGVWATITDDGHPVCWKYYNEEDDTQGEMCRRPLPSAKRIFVPQDKIIYSPRNPTGHGFLFVAHNGEPRCYFLPSGA